MISLRCTQKLLARLEQPGRKDLPEPTSVLGDWYANLVRSRPEQLVFCMNERSLLLVIIPAKESKTLVHRFRDNVLHLLEAIGVPHQNIEAEARSMSEIKVGVTANRRIVGCLNEAIFHYSALRGRERFVTLAEAEFFFTRNIYSPTGYRKPEQLARELFGIATATSAVH